MVNYDEPNFTEHPGNVIVDVNMRFQNVLSMHESGSAGTIENVVPSNKVYKAIHLYPTSLEISSPVTAGLICQYFSNDLKEL